MADAIQLVRRTIASGLAERAADERGMALFFTMGLVTLLLALTMGLVMTTSVDVQIAAAFRNGIEASAAADAAAHRALIDLAGIADWTPVVAGALQSSFVDGPPVGLRGPSPGPAVDLDLVVSLADCGHRPPCSDAERDAATRARPWGANNPRWQLFAYGQLSSLLPPGAARSPYYVTVVVADDPGERDGNPARDGPDPAEGGGVLLVRAEAFGPLGAHRAVELTAARTSPSGSSIRVVGRRETE